MTKFMKPIFTADEKNPKKTGMLVGYDNGMLIPGHKFIKEPNNTLEEKAIALKERVNGTARKRQNHTEINKFGYAVFYTGTNEIWFGVKYSCPNGVNTIARSARDKYYQLLGFSVFFHYLCRRK